MFDLTMELRTDIGKCLYEQIYEYIKKEIKGGKLLCGERLPSARNLAEHLQVSRSTVDFAYELLESEGYIEARPHKGHFVCKIEEELHMGDSPAAKRESGQLPRSYDDFVRSDKEKESRAGYDFSPNGLDISLFPFGVWKRITKNILSDAHAELFALGEPQGDEGLRRTIARYLRSSRGVVCTPEQIIVGAGNDYLLLLLEKILGAHAGIAMENPTYKRAFRILSSFAKPMETVGMDENGILVGELYQKEVKAAYVMPSHQFPTGVTMPIGRRMELLKWAAETDSYIIEDDYDSEFRYKGKPIPSLQGADRAGRVIYIGTFSKAIAPAIRVSYMVLPEGLLPAYQRECGFYASTVSRIDQRILDEFMREGYFERYLNKTRKLYREKHDLLLAALRPFTGEFRISGEHAGLHLLLQDKKKERSEQELCRLAMEADVKVYPLTDALVDGGRKTPLPPTVLLGYGGLGKEQITEGIEKLKQAWL